MHCQRQLFNKIRNRDVIFFYCRHLNWYQVYWGFIEPNNVLQTVLWTGVIEWPRKHINYTNGLSFNYSTLMHIKKKFPLNWSKTHCRMFENQKCSEHYLCSQLINSGSCAVLERCTPQENTFFFKILVVNKIYKIQKCSPLTPSPPFESKITPREFFGTCTWIVMPATALPWKSKVLIE